MSLCAVVQLISSFDPHKADAHHRQLQRPLDIRALIAQANPIPRPKKKQIGHTRTAPFGSRHINPKFVHISTELRPHNIAGGKLDHFKPSAILLRQQNTLAANINDPTLNRASQLFARLNDLLP